MYQKQKEKKETENYEIIFFFLQNKNDTIH